MAGRRVRKRHKFFFTVLRPVGRLIALRYHFKTKPVRLKKGEHYLILSNHQGLLDPALLALSFHAPVYFVATDSLFTDRPLSKLLQYCFGPIRKRKAASDVACIKAMVQTAREGGNIALFPEGNRTWCEFQFPITGSICRLVRLIKLPVLLYNFKGGYGVDPRWGRTVRRGSHVGDIRQIISWEEIENMSDEDLLSLITDGLKVFDSDSGLSYKSKRRAENLEHLLFICPKCRSISTLSSKGNRIKCSCCGLEVEYTENLQLSSKDEAFPYQKLAEWYQFQQEYVRHYSVTKGETIFTDRNMLLYDKTTAKRKLLAEGTLEMDDEALRIGDVTIKLADIRGASPVGGRKLSVNTKNVSYFFVGDDHFNPIKYLLFFNILCDRDTGGDNLYGL